MFKNKTASAARPALTPALTPALALALALAALPLAATTASAGHVQSAQSYYGAGPSISAAASQGANIYAPSGIGNITNNAAMNFAPGGGGGASFSGMTGNINVQTNINNTKVINSSSNVSVNETINGSNVAYGLNGADALDVINNANSEGAAVHEQFAGPASEIESEALAVAQSMGY
jgi:hypothetical protein